MSEGVAKVAGASCVMVGVIARKGSLTFGSASSGNQQAWGATWPQSTGQATEQEQIPGTEGEREGARMGHTRGIQKPGRSAHLCGQTGATASLIVANSLSLQA